MLCLALENMRMLRNFDGRTGSSAYARVFATKIAFFAVCFLVRPVTMFQDHHDVKNQHGQYRSVAAFCSILREGLQIHTQVDILI